MSFQSHTLIVITHVVVYQPSLKSAYVWFPVLMLNNLLRAIFLLNVAWYDSLIHTGFTGFVLTIICVRQI
jgi:hypothetical protein